MLKTQLLKFLLKMANLISKLNVYKLIPYPIAYPVGQDWPAKCQKKTSCVSTGWPVPLCIRQGAHRTSFRSRQCDVIASFSLSKPIKTPSKLIAGLAGRALPVHCMSGPLLGPSGKALNQPKPHPSDRIV